jgi:hypothetical protein
MFFSAPKKPGQFSLVGVHFQRNICSHTAGVLANTLVLVMGVFGRTPQFPQRGTGSREHWSSCMSMLVAGGGLAHGQVVGCTDARGGEARDNRVTPADIGATVFHHLGINLGGHWIDGQGRPQSIVTQVGRPIRELN